MALGRVRAIWTGVAGAPYYSSFYFTNEATQVCVDGVLGFFNQFSNRITNLMSIQVEDEALIFDETDGTVLGVEALTGGTVAGTAADEQLARATQMLLKFSTDGIVNNRRVQGRLYMAGLTSVVNFNGRPAAANIAELTAAYADNLQVAAIRDTNAHRVWSRPTDTRPGSGHLVTGWSTWSEFAVQRSRRD